MDNRFNAELMEKYDAEITKLNAKTKTYINQIIASYPKEILMQHNLIMDAGVSYHTDRRKIDQEFEL